jgi:glycosyltransferase involved in cell wall biosynthesis
MNIFMPYLDPYPFIHGIAIAIQEEGEALLKRGYEVHVVAPRWSADDEAPGMVNGIYYHRWEPDFRRIIQTSLAQGKEAWPEGYLEYEEQALRTLSETYQIDLLHVREPHGVKSALVLKRERDIPFVVSFHTFTPLYYRYLHNRVVSPLAGERWTDFCLQNIADIDQIITVSAAVKASYSDYGFPSEKMTVIYHGVDMNVFKPSQDSFLHKRYGLTEDTEILLAVSRLEPAKGQNELVRALPLVLMEHPSVHAVLLGGRANYEEVFKKELLSLAVQLGVADRITFDSLPYSEMPCAYASSTLVVSTSAVYEGFGRPMMEAAACGKAVVATNVGAHLEIVEHGETGYLIPPGEHKLVANSINDLLSSPTRRLQFGDAARQRALVKFSLEQCINKYIQVYRQALE